MHLKEKEDLPSKKAYMTSLLKCNTKRMLENVVFII